MRRALSLVLLLLATPASAEQNAPPAPPAQSMAGYVARLDALASDVRAAPAGDRGAASRLLSEVPFEFVVVTSGRTWWVPTSLLRAALADWQRAPGAPHQQAVIACLHLMRAQATAFERPPADAARARAALTEVLERQEFHDVREPSAIDRLREQVLAWLLRVLTRVFGASVIPTVTSLAIYVLIGLAVVAAGFWMYRALGRTGEREVAALELEAAPARPWDEWLTEARAEAARGRWAEAIRHAYWCGIALLEARGTWKPDPSRTPREYLALLPAGTSAAGLGGLTRLLERVWYGRAAASASSFDEAVACLRSMGCPSV